MPNDLGNQLKLQQEISKALKEQAGLMEQTTRLMSQQVGYAKQMAAALDASPMTNMSSQTQEVTEGLKKAAGEADNTSKSMGNLQKSTKSSKDQLKDQLKWLEKNSVAFGVAAGAARGFIGSLKGSWNMAKAFGKGLFAIIDTLGKLAQSIIAIPFKMWTGLIKMSQKGGIDPLRQALEKVRAEFGSLSSNEGAMMANSLKNLRKEARNMAGTGLSLARVFGYGREGLAEAMKFNQETATAMGSSFGLLGKQWEENATKIATFRKALGMTAEQQAMMLKMARASGQGISEAMDEISSMAVQMSEKFGFSAKVIGKAMGEMIADQETFGHMSVEAMGETAVYAKALGVEVKALGKLFDKFNNFENAAKGAAELAQAFGMSIDPMKMLNAESPAEMLEHLRQQFKAAGNSVENMNRHQLKLLSSSAGLSVEQTKLAFSQVGMASSYDDIKNGAEDAKKKQLTQAESMAKLASSIERLVKSGQHGFKGFFDAFLQGFSKGIVRSREFRKIMRNLQRSLRTVYRAGIRVGKLFVKLFPGIKDIAKGLRDLFDPKRFRILARRLVKVFKTFFIDMNKNPKEAVQNLLKSLEKTFKSQFSASGGALARIGKGFKTFFRAMGGIIAALIPMIKKNLAEGLEALVDLIVNPPTSALKKSAKGAQGFVMSIFGPIWQAIASNPALNKRISGAFTTLFNTLFEKLKKSKIVNEAIDWALKIIVVKALAGGLMNIFAGAVLGKLASIVSTGLGAIFTTGISGASPAIMAQMQLQAAQIQALEGQLAGTGAGAAAGSAGGVATKKFLVVLGAVMLALAVVAIGYKLLDLTVQDAVGIGLLMVAIAGSIALMSPPLQAISMMPPLNAAKLVPALIAMGAVMAALGGLGVILVRELGKIDKMPTLGAVGAYSAVMLLMLTMSLPLIGIASLIGKMTSQMGHAIVGMGILGLFMGALGLVGVHIAEMLGGVPNPEAVAKIMEALSSIMYATMAMLPVAGLLGTMLMQFPFGTAGTIIVAAGFEQLGGLASTMVENLLPAIKQLAELNIPNPEQFKMAADALVGIITAIAATMGAIGGIAGSLMPPSGDTAVFNANIVAFKDLINQLLAQGIGDIINKMVELAQSSSLTEQGVQAISAISGVLSGVASILQAFAPGEGAMAAIGKAAETWGADAENLTNVLLPAITGHMQAMMPVLSGPTGLFKVVGKFIAEIAEAVKGKDFSKVGPLMSAMGPMLTGVAKLMEMLNPTAGEMQAVAAESGYWASAARGFTDPKVMMHTTRRIRVMMPAMKDLLTTVGGEIGKLIDKLKPIISSIGMMKIDPKAIGAVAGIIGDIVSAMGSLMGGLSTTFKAILDKTPKGRSVSTLVGDFTTLLTGSITAMSGLTTPIKTFIDQIIVIAGGIKNPKGLKERVGIISKIFEIIASIGQIFSGGGALSYSQITMKGDVGKPNEQKRGIEWIKTSMQDVSKHLLGPTGPIQEFVNKIGGIKGVSKKITTRATRLGKVFKAMGSIAESVSDISAVATVDYAKLTGAGGILDAMDKTATSLNSVMKKSTHLTNPKRAAAIAKSIQTLDGALSRPMASTVAAVQAFSGGKLSVTHNLPDTKIVVKVNINAKEMAKQLAKVDISKEGMAKGYLGNGIGPDRSKVAP